MIIEKIQPHPDIPGVDRQVKVVRVDRIDYEEQTASIVIEVEHLTEEGTLHPYLGSFTAFMTSTNAKQVNQLGELVDPETPGSMGEFTWLYGAIEAGVPLHKLIRGLIQRNAGRGNFNNGNFRD